MEGSNCEANNTNDNYTNDVTSNVKQPDNDNDTKSNDNQPSSEIEHEQDNAKPTNNVETSNSGDPHETAAQGKAVHTVDRPDMEQVAQEDNTDNSVHSGNVDAQDIVNDCETEVKENVTNQETKSKSADSVDLETAPDVNNDLSKSKSWETKSEIKSVDDEDLENDENDFETVPDNDKLSPELEDNATIVPGFCELCQKEAQKKRESSANARNKFLPRNGLTSSSTFFKRHQNTPVCYDNQTSR